MIPVQVFAGPKWLSADDLTADPFQTLMAEWIRQLPEVVTNIVNETNQSPITLDQVRVRCHISNPLDQNVRDLEVIFKLEINLELSPEEKLKCDFFTAAQLRTALDIFFRAREMSLSYDITCGDSGLSVNREGMIVSYWGKPPDIELQ